MTWAAKASFSSTRSTLSAVQPAFSRIFRTAGTGVIMTSAGSSPDVAWATMRASAVRPFAWAVSDAHTTSAAAPSLTPGALPAVTVPPSRNAGLSLPSASSEVSSRGVSSSAIISGSPFFCGMGTGTISSLKRPALMAATALRWLCSAYSSCCWRVTP